MEPSGALAAYAAETAVEGTAGAGVAIAKPTLPLKATFHRISTSNPLARSSHSLSIIHGRAFIFGGEIRPREPVDNAVHIYTLPSSGVTEADYRMVPAQPITPDGEVPPARVGHIGVAISDRIYIFGGRGGPDMKPLEERGRVWMFDTMLSSWTPIDPVKGTPYPEARSYHAATASEHPLPSKDDHTMNPIGSTDLEAHGTIFVHGGCTISGREADVWSFDVAAETWSKYPDAPGPPRGGPSLALAHNRLYRFGGFDGSSELGGQIDYLELAVSTFDDQSGKGELALSLRNGKWQSVMFGGNARGPGNRSVAGLQAITTGQGRNYLLLFLGERDASSKGHEGAGKFWDDVWAFQLRPEGMTAASFKDATRWLFGAKSTESTWAQVDIPESSKTDGEKQHPGPRGWFASAQDSDMEAGSIVLWGGVNGKNEREADGWILTVDS